MNIKEKYPVGSFWLRLLENGLNVKLLVIDYAENPDIVCVITIGNQIGSAGNLSWINPDFGFDDCKRIPLLSNSQGEDGWGKLVFIPSDEHSIRTEKYKNNHSYGDENG